jgi:phosphonate transport system permease protein
VTPAPPLLLLLPALVVLPLALALPAQVHGGGWDLIGEFLHAAVTPSLEPLLLASLLRGLATTLAMALLGWSSSLLLGLGLGPPAGVGAATTAGPPPGHP